MKEKSTLSLLLLILLSTTTNLFFTRAYSQSTTPYSSILQASRCDKKLLNTTQQNSILHKRQVKPKKEKNEAETDSLPKVVEVIDHTPDSSPPIPNLPKPDKDSPPPTISPAESSKPQESQVLSVVGPVPTAESTLPLIPLPPVRTPRARKPKSDSIPGEIPLPTQISKEEKNPNLMLHIGIAAGVVFAIASVILIVCLNRRSKKRNKKPSVRFTPDNADIYIPPSKLFQPDTPSNIHSHKVQDMHNIASSVVSGYPSQQSYAYQGYDNQQQAQQLQQQQFDQQQFDQATSLSYNFPFEQNTGQNYVQYAYNQDDHQYGYNVPVQVPHPVHYTYVDTGINTVGNEPSVIGMNLPVSSTRTQPYNQNVLITNRIGTTDPEVVARDTNVAHVNPLVSGTL